MKYKVIGYGYKVIGPDGKQIGRPGEEYVCYSIWDTERLVEFSCGQLRASRVGTNAARFEYLEEALNMCAALNLGYCARLVDGDKMAPFNGEFDYKAANPHVNQDKAHNQIGDEGQNLRLPEPPHVDNPDDWEGVFILPNFQPMKSLDDFDKIEDADEVRLDVLAKAEVKNDEWEDEHGKMPF